MAPGIDGIQYFRPRAVCNGACAGVVEISKADGAREHTVSGGYIEVAHDKAVLLVETVDKAGEYDIERIKRNKEEQENFLSPKRSRMWTMTGYSLNWCVKCQGLRLLNCLPGAENNNAF